MKPLFTLEPEDLKIVDERIVNAILAFRKGNVIIHPGGGGQYGWLELPENLKESKKEGKLEPEKETAEKKKAQNLKREKPSMDRSHFRSGRKSEKSEKNLKKEKKQ